MSNASEIPLLNHLEYIAYLDEEGKIPQFCQGKIGIYAIFDRDRVLQLVAYSRDVYLSLKQHLARQPQNCYWFKITTIERPSRTVLETIKATWIEENGSIPIGNDEKQAEWNAPIDIKPTLTEEERKTYENSEEFARTKFLKKVARRVEAKIIEQLTERGVQEEIRFNPKLKEKGLLDLK